jgi:hypothetical protein
MQDLEQILHLFGCQPDRIDSGTVSGLPTRCYLLRLRIHAEPGATPSYNPDPAMLYNNTRKTNMDTPT